MAEWKTVRFDPNYEEKLDPEIIPLCDALNDAGFVTTSSCAGHGRSWSSVWFEHSTDERIERMARFVHAYAGLDYAPHFAVFKKEVLLDGYRWSIEIHVNNLFADTSAELVQERVRMAIADVARLVKMWRSESSGE
jgi:hypothetical protein